MIVIVTAVLCASLLVAAFPLSVVLVADIPVRSYQIKTDGCNCKSKPERDRTVTVKLCVFEIANSLAVVPFLRAAVGIGFSSFMS